MSAKCSVCNIRIFDEDGQCYGEEINEQWFCIEHSEKEKNNMPFTEDVQDDLEEKARKDDNKKYLRERKIKKFLAWFLIIIISIATAITLDIMFELMTK